MSEKLWCIVDASVSQSQPLEGLENLTMEAAEEWVSANQIILEEEIEGFNEKYRICPQGNPEITE